MRLQPSGILCPKNCAERRRKPSIPEGRVLNLLDGEWKHPGFGRHYESAIDGRSLGRIPMLDLDSALAAVKFAKSEAHEWARVDLDERRRRVAECLAALKEQRELIALLLMWEIGKPYAQALTDIDRCISGVEWYLEHIPPMLAGRAPLGLISNIASWNYPMSVLMHAVLVQVLAGNATISKTPTDGGLYALTLAHAIARRAGLPVSLVSGSGGQLSDALVRNEFVDCLAFVGGKTNGGVIASTLYDEKKRYMLEMEGVNTYGVWQFSNWPLLAEQLRKGFDYGKQRCTAYVRFIVQRELFPQFLEMYLPVLRSLRFGNPVLVESPADPFPKLDFGPLINSKKVEELRVLYIEALGKGAISLYRSHCLRKHDLPQPGYFRLRRPRRAAEHPAQLPPVPRRAVRPAGHHRRRRSSRRTRLRNERLQRRARFFHRLRRSENCPSCRFRTPRLQSWHQLVFARAAIAKKSSAASANPGKAASSAAATSSSPSRPAPRTKTSSAISPTTPNSPKKPPPNPSPPPGNPRTTALLCKGLYSR